MHGRHPKPKALFPLTLVLLALAAAPAMASPAGDPDPAFGDTGTQFRPLQSFGQAKPLVSPVPGGGAVSAVGQYSEGDYLRVHGYSDGGAPAFFPAGQVEVDVPEGLNTLLDNRVLPTGDIVLTMSAYQSQSNGSRLVVASGGLLVIVLNSVGVEQSRRFYETECDGSGEATAARSDAEGNVAAAWDCSGYTRVSRYLRDEPAADADDTIDGMNEEATDLELGSDGTVYVLGRNIDEPNGGGGGSTDTTGTDTTAPSPQDVDDVVVARLGATDLLPDGGYGDGQVARVADGATTQQVDLAVDASGRAVVWTRPREGDAAGTWTFYRLLAGNGALDTSWGPGGKSDIVNPVLGRPDPEFDAYMTTTPGGKVVAFGPGASDSDSNDPSTRVVIRLSDGALDPSWGTNGITTLELDVFRFVYAGDPRLQSDGKVYLPYTVVNNSDRQFARVLLPDPGDSNHAVGVTRLNPDGTTGGGAGPIVLPRPVTSSAVPAICGRRAISLVRADVRGKRVKLSGLVGRRLFGKTVTIQTNYGAKASAFTKAGTVKASSTGTFTAFVPKPSAGKFKGARFRAVSGSARSPQLKLPQSLTSRSVKSAAGTITVKGRVKRSVLGKRNRVTIRRLVCGRYRTVGKAKPASDGSYTIKFNATTIRGVAFYRAEAIVQVRPGAKKYAIQYARALAIKVNDQTG